MKKSWIILLVLVIVVGTAVSSCQPGGGSSPQAGEPAPDFELPDLDGRPVSLSGLRGQPVLVNFWATWCGPCVHEMPFLQEVHEEWSGRGLVILAVDVAEDPDRVRNFVASNGLSFAVLLDEGGEVADTYSVRGIPTSVFIDREGVIQVVTVGSYPGPDAIEGDLNKIIP